jgi:hypothetical protein
MDSFSHWCPTAALSRVATKESLHSTVPHAIVLAMTWRFEYIATQQSPSKPVALCGARSGPRTSLRRGRFSPALCPTLRCRACQTQRHPVDRSRREGGPARAASGPIADFQLAHAVMLRRDDVDAFVLVARLSLAFGADFCRPFIPRPRTDPGALGDRYTLQPWKGSTRRDSRLNETRARSSSSIKLMQQ